MTWPNYIATGVGGDGIELRLVIEGCEIELCTTEEMVTGSLTETGQGGKRRVNGLQREGLGFSESGYLAGAELSVSINAARVMETPYPFLDSMSSVFTALPATLCYLSASLGAADATMVVDSDDDLTVGDFVHVSTETMKITSLLGAGVCGISRGQWRTTAQRHSVTTQSGRPAVRALRDGVRIWAGRRTWLYAHGPTELGADDLGTLVCRGKLSAEPQLDADAIMWNLPMDSRWGLLDQEIGAGLDKPRALRGAYYPGQAPFTVLWLTSNSGTHGGPYTTAGLTPGRRIFAGHYETNAEFMTAVVAEMNTAAPLFDFGWTEVAGQWELTVQIPSPARYLEMWGGSAVDGWFSTRLVPLAGYGSAGGTGRAPGVGDVTAGTTYIVGWSDAPAIGGFAWGVDPLPVPLAQMRRIPRTINAPVDWTGAPEADVVAYPTTTVYLDDVTGIAAGDTLLITQPSSGGDESPVLLREVGSVDTVTGTVTTADGRSLMLVSAGSATSEIKISKTIGNAAGCTLADFRNALIADAPDGANDASTPWILGDDLADWTGDVRVASAGHDFLLRRIYAFYQGVRCSEVIKHDLRAHGLFPYLDADFKIGVRPLTLDTASVPLNRYLSEADGTLLTGDSFGELQSGEDGNVNVVEFSRGYDPVEDKHTGAPITVVTVEGVSEAHKRRILEIKPKARPVGLEINPDEAYRLTDPVRGLFGAQILHYSFSVPATFWPVLLGDSVVITSPQLPYGGKRGVHDPGEGMHERTGLVVGREWDFESGTGKLTVLVTGLNVAGYAPSALVESQSGASTTWTVTCDAEHYAPAGARDVSYFEIGDRIRLIEWDAETPTVITGEVLAVDADASTMDLELDGAWSPVGATWVVSYAKSDDASLAETQRAYCYVANSANRIDDGGTGATARVFAP